MGTQRRGFAGMSRDVQRAIAGKGGKSAHARGTAHAWTVEEAREAGRKGGLASAAKRREKKDDAAEQMRLRNMATGGRP